MADRHLVQQCRCSETVSESLSSACESFDYDNDYDSDNEANGLRISRMLHWMEIDMTQFKSCFHSR